MVDGHIFEVTRKILIASLGIAAIMLHNVLLHDIYYMLWGLVLSENYVVVLGTAVSVHILLQVEGTQTCKIGSIGHLSRD